VSDVELGTFEGRPVVGMAIVVRRTGDGLSETVKVDPVRIGVGDEGYIVFAYKCVDVHHPAENRRDPAAGGVVRTPILDASTATFVDADVVATAIAEQAERNRRYIEETRNRQYELRDAELIEAHDKAEHVGDVFPVRHCPRCAEEVEAVAREAAAEEAGSE